MIRLPRARLSALVLGALILLAAIADVPLAALAHQSVEASGGSLPVWISAAFGGVGFVVVWRKPRNLLGWTLLGLAVFGALSEDASFYNLADYHLRHGRLPFGWVSLLLQPAWAPALVLLGLSFLLFPDSQPPSSRWRPVVWAFVAVGLAWVISTLVLTVGAIIGHRLQVDIAGRLGHHRRAYRLQLLTAQPDLRIRAGAERDHHGGHPRAAGKPRRGHLEVPAVGHRPDHLPDAGVRDRHRAAGRAVRRDRAAGHPGSGGRVRGVSVGRPG